MKDATLGGYLREHERPPAFEGSDGDSYTVEPVIDSVDPDEGSGWRGYLLFLRWRGTEAVGHVESDYISLGSTEEEAREVLESMTLYDIRALLDALLAGTR